MVISCLSTFAKEAFMIGIKSGNSWKALCQFYGQIIMLETPCAFFTYWMNIYILADLKLKCVCIYIYINNVLNDKTRENTSDKQ